MNEKTGKSRQQHFPHFLSQVMWKNASVPGVAQKITNIDSKIVCTAMRRIVALLAFRISSRVRSLMKHEFPQTSPFFCCINKFQEHNLEAYTAYRPPPPRCLSVLSPSPVPCRPVQYIHHSFINSENSSLVNCLEKFNFKRKLLKEKDIITLQGFLCPLLVQGEVGRGDMCCEPCSSAPHCSMSGKSYTHV